MTSAKTLLRRQNILSMIREYGEVSLDEISRMFEISQATLRRELKALEDEGEVFRLNRNTYTTNSYHYRESTSFLKNKTHLQIAKAVVESLDNNTIIFLGPDLINETVSEVLCTSKHGLTILASNLKHATILRNQNMHDIYLLGGCIDPKSGVLTGPLTEKIISEIISDVAIFGCKAINPEKGIIFDTADEAQFVHKVINYCRKLFILADHSQFSRETCGAVFPFNKVDSIFTDKISESEVSENFKDLGIKILQTQLSTY